MSPWFFWGIVGLADHVSAGHQLGGDRGGQTPTCDGDCTSCAGPNSCNATGTKNFDGGGACGADELGPILCNWVMWTCRK